jgi:hypothetical protein
MPLSPPPGGGTPDFTSLGGTIANGPYDEVDQYGGYDYYESISGNVLSVGEAISGPCAPGFPGYSIQGGAPGYSTTVTPTADTTIWNGAIITAWMMLGLDWVGGEVDCVTTIGVPPSVIPNDPTWDGDINDTAGLGFSYHIEWDGSLWTTNILASTYIDVPPSGFVFAPVATWIISGVHPTLPGFTISSTGGGYIQTMAYAINYTAFQLLLPGVDPVNPGPPPHYVPAPPYPDIQPWPFGPCAGYG